MEFGPPKKTYEIWLFSPNSKTALFGPSGNCHQGSTVALRGLWALGGFDEVSWQRFSSQPTRGTARRAGIPT